MDTFRIKFTPEMLERFKIALAKAKEEHPQDKDAVFVFDGKQWLVSYAEYLAAYLSGVFMTGRDSYESDE
jgi:hypothetical protein